MAQSLKRPTTPGKFSRVDEITLPDLKETWTTRDFRLANKMVMPFCPCGNQPAFDFDEYKDSFEFSGACLIQLSNINVGVEPSARPKYNFWRPTPKAHLLHYSHQGLQKPNWTILMLSYRTWGREPTPEGTVPCGVRSWVTASRGLTRPPMIGCAICGRLHVSANSAQIVVQSGSHLKSPPRSSEAETKRCYSVNCWKRVSLLH